MRIPGQDNPPQPGPFQQDVKQLALRFHQLPKELSADAQPSDISHLAEKAGFAFSLGAARYRYDRFGLQRLKADAATTSLQGENK